MTREEQKALIQFKIPLRLSKDAVRMEALLRHVNDDLLCCAQAQHAGGAADAPVAAAVAAAGGDVGGQ